MSPYEPKLKTEDAKNIWKQLLRSDVVFKGESLYGISHLKKPYFPVEFLKNDAARFYKNLRRTERFYLLVRVPIKVSFHLFQKTD